ncbi:MAG TPA: hemerythrin domain-containing protein [Magnetovibrio sp.]
MLELIDSLKTGHVDIDDDHADIIDTINEAMDMAQDREMFTQVPARLDSFVDSCEAHFRKEERILAEANYPLLAEHTAYHDQMLSKARTALQHFCVAHNHDERIQYLEAIIGFLIDDILCSDMTFVSYLKEKGLAHDQG